MTDEDVERYMHLHAVHLPELWKKYGLKAFRTWDHTINEWRYGPLAIAGHWLVCRWLEEHPDEQLPYLTRQPGFMYFDILDRAEQEYCGMAPFRERLRAMREEAEWN
jgi:hypothetical protein